MEMNNPFNKNIKFWLGVIFTVIEGLLSACVYITIYLLLNMLLEDNVTWDGLTSLTGLIVGIFIVRLLLYGFGYTEGQIGGAIVSKNIRLYLGYKLKRIRLGNFNQGNIGNFVNSLTSDVKGYEQILTHKIGNIVKNVSLSVMLLVFVCYIYLPAGLILVAATLLFIPNTCSSFLIVKKYGTARNEICAKAVSSIVEYINGIQTLRAYGLSGKKNKKTTQILKDYSYISYKYEACGIPFEFAFSILIWLTLPLVMMVASKPWIAGTLADCDFLMVAMMPMLLAKMYTSISLDLFSYKNMMISKNKIEKVMDEPEDRGSVEKFNPSNYGVKFENVCFSYEENEPVLKDVTFEAKDGQFTAIVGDSGSGKSTIMNLLAKYYEPNAGKIIIGNTDISEIKTESVLDKISTVDQDVFLFDDSIKENIRYAKLDATDEEIKKALTLANCDGFVSKLEKGYDTPVGENGCLLSGGERQRLSIARAIVKKSEILLLDEATASLDIENELAVKEAIANLLQEEKTVIMIAHTLSVIKNANNILVVSDGKIVEQGTHEQLLSNKGKYFSMWEAEKKIGA